MSVIDKTTKKEVDIRKSFGFSIENVSIVVLYVVIDVVDSTAYGQNLSRTMRCNVGYPDERIIKNAFK